MSPEVQNVGTNVLQKFQKRLDYPLWSVGAWKAWKVNSPNLAVSPVNDNLQPACFTIHRSPRVFLLRHSKSAVTASNRCKRKGLLPPTSVGWGEGNIFSLFFCPHSEGGVPQFQVLSQVSGSRSFAVGTPVLARGRRYPSPGWGEGVRCGRYALCGFPLEDILVRFD